VRDFPQTTNAHRAQGAAPTDRIADRSAQDKPFTSHFTGPDQRQKAERPARESRPTFGKLAALAHRCLIGAVEVNGSQPLVAAMGNLRQALALLEDHHAGD
jgi:hypothetical protein